MLTLRNSVRVFSFLNANPRSKDPTIKRFYTRNHIDCIPHNIGKPLPLFTELPYRLSGSLPPGMVAKFDFSGYYEIVSYELLEKGSAEVKAFISSRGEAKKPRTPEAWQAQLNSTWARIDMKRCDKAVQTALGNPMLDAPVTQQPVAEAV